jgi:hypothetical protein
MTETEACIALNMVPNLGPMRLQAAQVFGTPQRIPLKAGELRSGRHRRRARNTIAGGAKQIDLSRN